MQPGKLKSILPPSQKGFAPREQSWKVLAKDLRTGGYSRLGKMTGQGVLPPLPPLDTIRGAKWMYCNIRLQWGNIHLTFRQRKPIH